MKKMIIFIVIVIFILVGVWISYQNYKTNYNSIKKHNLEFEKYENKEIYGVDLTTIINQAVNYNESNGITKDSKGMYTDNGKNSIKIEIKITDNKTTYQMESFYNNGMESFVNYYGNIKFKCTKIDYHENKNIKYMLFEQITE